MTSAAATGFVGLFSVNPLHWVGDAATQAASDGWTAAMDAIWMAALWLLQLAFTFIDAFTTPDLSAGGPMGAVLPTTLWVAATLVVLMMLVQLCAALVRRDGQSLGRITIGIAQFGLVWSAFLGVGTVLVAAAGALARAILQAMLHVDVMGSFNIGHAWPREVADPALATVLAIVGVLIIIPAALAYVIIMLVRAVALIVLAATTPISAAGLVNETTKVWFWKSLRWFFAALLIPVAAALALGIGVKLSAAVTAGSGDKLAASVGSAVTGGLLVLVGACCPMVLFRLFAFIEPGTSSGMAMRQSLADNGGTSGLLGGSGNGSSSAATATGSSGASAGEDSAEAQTQSRVAGTLGGFGQAMGKAAGVAQTAAAAGGDILASAGVGDPGMMTAPGGPASKGRSGSNDTDPDQDGGGGGLPAPLPPVPAPPALPAPPGMGGAGEAALPGGSSGPAAPGAGGGSGGGAAGGSAAGGGEAAAAAVAL